MSIDAKTTRTAWLRLKRLQTRLDEACWEYEGPHNAIAAYCMADSGVVCIEAGDYDALDRKTNKDGIICIIRRLKR